MSPSKRPPVINIMRHLGYEPDPWQLEVLEGQQPRVLLNCSRQAGKSTVVAILALAEAVWTPYTKVLLLSRSRRQSRELFGVVAENYRRLNVPLPGKVTADEIRMGNRSRVVCLPCNEETIRGYASVHLMVIDEAARVPDDLYRAVRPMLAVSRGRLICLSTPYGRRGFFHDAWANGGSDWHRIEVPAAQIPRITPEFLEQERRGLGESWFRQEYCCSFEALEGLVYPDFGRCVVPGPAPAGGRKVGGLDFGFRNPFAALWGTLDRDGVLWLTGEHYVRQRPLSFHAQRLPRDVVWYADPAGANERSELSAAGFAVRTGTNDLRLGIAAVSARLENGTLKVVEGACPNLLAEAGLYRYKSGKDSRRAEAPVDDHNHALAALRYLISRLDAHRLARVPGVGAPASVKPPRPWLRLDNEFLWQAW